MNDRTPHEPANRGKQTNGLSVCRRTQTLVLPENTGPIHTLLIDDQGTAYYSDEINHCVASTDTHGNLLWRCDSVRSGNERFHYPRGIALGSVEHGGSPEACLAVADGWNRRIRFLTRDGRYLHSWDAAGSSEFGELADVRFIADQSNSRGDLAGGYWLILDRGNHRVCGLGQDGSPLFQVGRPMAPFVTKHWSAPALAPRENEDISLLNSDFPPFDFLYYPTRMFGRSEDAIFVWQPLRQRLTILIYGNLLPIASGPSSIGEFIAADGAGFVAWSCPDRKIIFFDATCEVRSEAETDGIPVPSNAPSHECWVQSANVLHRLTLEWTDAGGTSLPWRNTEIVFRTAHKELDRWQEDEGKIADSVGRLRAIQDSLTALADRLCAAGPKGQGLAEDPAVMLARLSDLKNECSRARISFCDAVQPFLLAVLKVKLGAPAPHKPQSNPVPAFVLHAWKRLLDPLETSYSTLMRQVDDLYLLLAKINEVSYSDNTGPAELRSLAERLQSDICEAANWIEKWCRSGPRPGPFLLLPHSRGKSPIPDETPVRQGLLLRQPSRTMERGSPELIREVGQIHLGRFAGSGLSQPFGIAVGGEGRLFVSLFASHKIVAFDPLHEPVFVLGGPGSGPGEFNGPTGLAIDESGHLYVADSYNRRIQVFSPPYGPPHRIQILAASSGQSTWLAGMCVLPDGGALAADAGGHRIVRAAPSGFCEPFLGHEGRGRGEFRNPVSFCMDCTEKEEKLWIVDKRNHRLQCFDLTGKYLAEIGGCHLKPASLLYPISAAVMPDASIVVGLEPPEACLVFFSSAGKELGRFFLNYAPGGMAVRGGQLFVCQFDGDCIHVYEQSQIPA